MSKPKDRLAERCWHMQLPPIIRRVLSHRVILLRSTRRWSQRKCAEESGIAISTLNSIEGERAKDLKLTTFVALYEVFEVDPGYLLGMDTETKRAIGTPKDTTKCPHCGGKLHPHAKRSTSEWLVHLSDQGKSIPFLMSEFLMSREAIELLLGEEYQRIRKQRRNAIKHG